MANKKVTKENNVNTTVGSNVQIILGLPKKRQPRNPFALRSSEVGIGHC